MQYIWLKCIRINTNNCYFCKTSSFYRMLCTYSMIFFRHRTECANRRSCSCLLLSYSTLSQFSFSQLLENAINLCVVYFESNTNIRTIGSPEIKKSTYAYIALGCTVSSEHRNLSAPTWSFQHVLDDGAKGLLGI